MENQRLFVTISGRKLYWEAFISGLDYGRHSLRFHARSVDDMYCHMIYPLQDITNDWHNGENEMTENLTAFAERYGYGTIKEKRLPEALDEMFSQMQERLHVDLGWLLESIQESSGRKYADYVEQQDNEKKRRGQVQGMYGAALEQDASAAEDDVRILYAILSMKQADPGYRMREKEFAATRLLADLVLQKQVSRNITCSMLRALNSGGFIEPSEIDALLEKNGDKRDSEWYLEDIFTWEMEDETDFKAGDILDAAADRLLAVIGLERANLRSL